MIRAVEFQFDPQFWMKEGACTDPSVDPEWWFPVNQHRKEYTTQVALQICNSCPVKAECMVYALDNWPMDGIWGGLLNTELKKINKTRKKVNQ